MPQTMNLSIEGHVKIVDLTANRVLFEGHNAINSETMSIVIANMLKGNLSNYISELHIGNGGTVIDEDGNITYKDVVENLELGTLAELYNPLYYKIVDELDTAANDDPTRNFLSVVHSEGLSYTDLTITCTLEEDQPSLPGSSAGEVIFNELGLKNRNRTGLNSGYLLSHVVFEPVTKNAGRVVQIVYTLRIRL
jgi:hypothetical protein